MPLRRPASIGRQVRQQSRQLLTTGRRFERFDQIRQRHFWSTCFFAPDANGYITGNRQLFVTPPGQNGQGFPSGYSLNEADTNWKSANRVPDNQNFEITELGVSLVPVPDAVSGDTGYPPPSGRLANDFLQNALISITYLTNSVPLGLACDFAQASGASKGTHIGLNNNTTGQSPSIQSNGLAAPALRRRFKIPILLQHGETFSFDINLPRAVYVGADEYPVMPRFDFFATESFAEKS